MRLQGYAKMLISNELGGGYFDRRRNLYTTYYHLQHSHKCSKYICLQIKCSKYICSRIMNRGGNLGGNLGGGILSQIYAKYVTR